VISKPKRISVADGVVHIIVLLYNKNILHKYVSLLYDEITTDHIVNIIKMLS